MKHKQYRNNFLFLTILLMTLHLSLSGCDQPSTQKPKVSQTRIGEMVTYSQIEEAYQALQAGLYSYKRSIDAHEAINKLTSNSDDPLNKRDNLISKQRIIELSHKLITLCERAANNSSTISLTSGQQENIKTYLDFGRKKLKEYN